MLHKNKSLLRTFVRIFALILVLSMMLVGCDDIASKDDFPDFEPNAVGGDGGNKVNQNNNNNSKPNNNAKPDDNNANDINTTGFWMGENITNAPPVSNNWVYIESLVHNDLYQVQKATDLHDSSKRWTRHKTSGEWSDWREL